MAQFSAAQVGLSVAASATTLQYWVLTQLTAGDIASVKMVNWGGGDTSLIAIATRWARVNNTPATPTALTIQSSSPGITSNSTVNTYGTAASAATSPAGLLQQNWNSQGGGGVVVLPIGGEWRVSGGALGTVYNQIGCGCTAGTSSNLSFGVQFEE
jgi:hypothetical protein